MPAFWRKYPIGPLTMIRHRSNMSAISQTLPFCPTAVIAALALAPSAAATTSIDNDWTSSNQNLPPGYGSNVSATSKQFTATLGATGVTGTPDITLAWAPNGAGGWQSYNNWNGRGDAIQVDGNQVAHTVTFSPIGTAAVRIISVDFDEWTGGGTVTANWSLSGPSSGSLASGTWTGDNAGIRETIAINAQGAIGEDLILSIEQSSGSASYFAIDNLVFDQITDDGTPLVVPRQPSFTVGTDIIIDFSGGPGNAADWIAIDTQGNTPNGDPPMLEWLYTNGSQTAGGDISSGSVTFSSPTLAAGTYAIWFLENDGYNVIAGPSELIIVDPLPGEPPTWVTTNFRRRHAIVGTAYSGKISAYASDPDGDPLTFSKIGTPTWLTVSSTGTLGGTPTAGDVGSNTFTVRVSDGSNTADASMSLEVFDVGTEQVGQIKILSYNFWHGWGQMKPDWITPAQQGPRR